MRLTSSAGLILLAALSAQAQVGNQGLVVRDHSLGSGQGQVVPPGTDPFGVAADYLITPELGEEVGNHTLLHSFQEFGVGTGETATFTGADSIRHIVGRVTGTNGSSVDGTIRSTVEGADLFMINPNGFVFGENAKLDVRGSFHVTTADYLRWGDERFEARPGGLVPTLAFAEPTAFGFLDPAPPGVRFESALARPEPLTVPPDETFGVIGGDIEIDGARLQASAGEILLVSVASEGEVVADALDDVQGSFSRLGAIALRNRGQLETSGEGGGRIVVRGDSLEVVDGAVIRADTRGARDGLGVDVEVKDLLISGAFSGIFSGSADAGDGGPIRLRVGTLDILEGGNVRTDVHSSGAGGAIEVYASESVHIAGRFRSSFFAVLSGLYANASPPATGPGGSISVVTPTLHLSDSGTITAATFGASPAGSIDLHVNTLALDRGARVNGFKAGTGEGANIRVIAEESILIEGSDPVFLCNFGTVPCQTAITTAVDSFGTAAKGGDIRIETPFLHIRDAGIVFTDTAGAADGGATVVRVDRLLLENGGRLNSGKNSTGASGPIDVTATESISISGYHELSPCLETVCFSGIFTSSLDDGVEGDVADITIDSPLLELTDGGWISSGTRGDADSGDIVINVDTLVMRPNEALGEAARIENRTQLGSGDGGRVDITATNLIDIQGSRIETGTEADATGSAGDVELKAPLIRLRDATVTSTNEGPGDGGTVTLDADLLIDARSSTISTAVIGAATGGDVRLEAGQLIFLKDATEVRADAPLGAGGRIEITTPLFIRSADTVLDASGGVEGGEVIINSPEQIIVDQVAPLPVEFLDASSMLLASCAARNTGERAGSFTVARWRGLPLSPEGPLLAFAPLGSLPSRVADLGTALPPVAAGEAVPGSMQVAYAALEQGADAFRSGSLEVASSHWQEASEAAAQTGNTPLEGDALRGLAQTEQIRGEYAASIAPLEEALALARGSSDPAREAAALGSLGDAYLALRDPARATQYLDEAVAIARNAQDTSLAATLLNNRGNQHAAAGTYEEALDAYLESARVAATAGDPLRVAQARANAARAALDLGRSEQASDLLIRARLAIANLPPTRDGIALRIHLARSYHELAQRSPAHWEEGLRIAHRTLQDASARAQSLSDLRSLSYTRGNLGALYQLEGRNQEALLLTQEALRSAEDAEAADLMARWHGQIGALLWAAGESRLAIDSFRRAVDLMEETRPEMRARYGALDLKFQREVKPVYLALVDALLQGATIAGDANARQYLAEARNTVERWKAAELRDYFRDECVAELEARAAPAESLSRTAAVVYPILLPERLELLISGAWGIERHTVAVGAEQVSRTAQEFRRLLNERTTRRYLRPARELHEWLVAPYAESLERHGIDTLVFVPGGALRTIPMAALHDGREFLVERYAVAVTPSLELLAPEPLDPAKSQLLLAGVSEAVQDHPALRNVPDELSAIQDLYGGELLLDKEFELAQLEESLRERRPGIVHLASHATFTGDPATSFVLTHDTKLTMDRLSELVGSRRFQEEPLELLVLSACSTAAGDERAALGLSGVAIRAGARSALGSLWNVSDRASSELIVDFYRALGTPEVSKAEALRKAQREMLASASFQHPFYWAPFLMINNWL